MFGFKIRDSFLSPLSRRTPQADGVFNRTYRVGTVYQRQYSSLHSVILFLQNRKKHLEKENRNILLQICKKYFFWPIFEK